MAGVQTQVVADVTVAEQYEVLIERLRTKRRNPLKESSLAAYRAYARNWICPQIGQVRLAEFGPRDMKDFVSQLAASLSPKTTNEIVSFVKQIVASATDEHGLPLHPRTWDSDFIDLPIVSQQRTPTVSREQIERALSESTDTMCSLIACLAGSGLRINEALAIRIGDSSGPHSSFDALTSTIHIRRSLWRGREQSSPKTPSAIRVVEIPYALGAMLQGFAGQRDGYLFGNGKPFAESTAREHLAKLKLPPFHAFRRFRTTTLRAARCPEDVVRYWLGHSDHNVTDRYSKLGLDVAVRREWAERVGAGFNFLTEDSSQTR